MSKRGKASGGPVDAKTAPGEGKSRGAELSTPERRVGRPFPKGVSGNPGGVSKEKRAFLERLQSDDAEDVYEAFMGLVREGNAPAVLRAVEYLAGKPAMAAEDRESMEKAGKRLSAEQLISALGLLGAHDAG